MNISAVGTTASAFISSIALATAAGVILPAAASNLDLEPFYNYYDTPRRYYPADPNLFTANPPVVKGTLGPIAAFSDIVDLFVRIESSSNEPGSVRFFGPQRFVPCSSEAAVVVPSQKYSGATFTETRQFRYGVPTDIYSCRDGDYLVAMNVPPVRWVLDERFVLRPPVRRKALDGGEFDASPMVIERAGNPWITYYWGYKLGLVESQSDWNDANRSKMPADWPVFPAAEDNFKLTTLPPPWVEGEVTEYVNSADFPKQPDGQYFYAATDEDRAALDAVPAWQRTGNRFKHGGYVSVCRFYGGKNGGPNTHFYSASDSECNWLKSFSFLSYEGQTFRVNLPLPLAANAPSGTQPNCPAGSIPLYRLYNNAGAPGKTYVSNHRYVTTRSAVDAAVAKGWLDEGTVMCVPQ